jgi:hypothetical protein
MTIELGLMDGTPDNATGADNQQERLPVDRFHEIRSFLSGFALGEGSFMLVCRPRSDYRRGWKISAAFNVSQKDVVPLELFQAVLGCGRIRKGGNDGWYLEVNNLVEIHRSVIPFFRRYPLVGRKAHDFELFAAAVELLRGGKIDDTDFNELLLIREQLNRGEKRQHRPERILRGHTPDLPLIEEG